MTNRIKSIVAVLLIGLMVFSLTACSGDTNEWAVKIGDQEIKTGVYLGYLVNNYLAAQDKTGKSGDDLFAVKIEEKTAEQWIKDQTMEDCTVYAYVEQFFASENLELSKDDLTEITTTTDNAWKQVNLAYEKNGCSKESYRQIITSAKKADKLFRHLYGEKGDRAVDLKEQQSYFLKNYAKTKIIFESLADPSNGQQLPKDKLDKIVKDFKQMTNDLIDGKKFDDLADKYNDSKKEETSGSSSSELSSKKEPEKDPARYEAVVNKNNSYFPQEVIDRLFDASFKVNDPAFVQTSDYIFMMQKMELTGDGKEFKDSQEEIITALRGDDFKKELIAEGKKLKVEKNEAAIKRFSPKNIPGRFLEASEPMQPVGYPEA